MANFLRGKKLTWLLLAILAFPLLRQFLPIATPFLMGLALAAAAEPTVKWLHHRKGMRRSVAAGIGVTGVFLLSATLLVLLTSLLIKQAGHLTKWLPQISEAISQGTLLLQQWLLSIVGRMPDHIYQVMNRMITSLFDGNSSLLQSTAARLTQLAGNALGKLSNGFIGTVTAILSAFMFSVRLPQFRQRLQGKIPPQLIAAGKEFRRSLGRWLLAQGKLASVAFVLLWMGFMLLKIQKPLLWAALVTMVDILPILGVGTILIPWSIVSFLQGNNTKALGLAGIFLIIWLIRSALEPKLIGKELGLDPLLTLSCIYAGLKLWGIPGMLLAPAGAVCLVQLGRQYKLHANEQGL